MWSGPGRGEPARARCAGGLRCAVWPLNPLAPRRRREQSPDEADEARAANAQRMCVPPAACPSSLSLRRPRRAEPPAMVMVVMMMMNLPASTPQAGDAAGPEGAAGGGAGLLRGAGRVVPAHQHRRVSPWGAGAPPGACWCLACCLLPGWRLLLLWACWPRRAEPPPMLMVMVVMMMTNLPASTPQAGRAGTEPRGHPHGPGDGREHEAGHGYVAAAAGAAESGRPVGSCTGEPLCRASEPARQGNPPPN